MSIAERLEERRRSQFKNLVSTHLDERRKNNQEQSRKDRAQMIESLRSICEVGEEIPSSSKPRGEDIRVKKIFARTFMHPDSMLEVPPDLADWFVMLRPEGERCLIILKNNVLYLRSRNGNLIDEVILDPFSLKRPDSFGVFDGVFAPNTGFGKKKIYVFDLLCWNKTDLIDSEYECRQYFLRQHFPFESSNSAPALMGDEDMHAPEISLLHSAPVTRDSLSSMYRHDLSIDETDSLVFFKKSSKYEAGLTQSALFFRDSHLSRFCIDTAHADGFEEGDEDQLVVLKLKREGGNVFLRTWDNVVMKKCLLEDLVSSAVAPQPIKDAVDRLASSRKHTVMIRVPLDRIDDFSQWAISKKPFASSFNRIVDQFRKRRAATHADPTEKPLDFTTILDAAS